MRLTQYNVGIFVDELKSLSKLIDSVEADANAWIEQQKRRETHSVSQYATQTLRLALENRLNELRLKLATVYDFQGDRGMVDFVLAEVSRNGNHYEEEEEEVDELSLELVEDEIVFAKTKKGNSLLKTFFSNYVTQ